MKRRFVCYELAIYSTKSPSEIAVVRYGMQVTKLPDNEENEGVTTYPVLDHEPVSTSGEKAKSEKDCFAYRATVNHSRMILFLKKQS